MHVLRQWWPKARLITRRSIIVGIIFALIALTCIARLVMLQLVDSSGYAKLADQSRSLKVVLQAQRGKILDANQTVLAQSVERYNVIANPLAIQSFEPTDCEDDDDTYCHSVDGQPVGAKGAAAIARMLAPVLDMDPLELGAALVGSSQYAVIARDVTPEVKRTIDSLYIGGYIFFELSSDRIYSAGNVLGPILGGVNIENTGVSGIELLENDYLSGTDGYVVYQQGLGGETIPGTTTEQQDAVNGSDITLTIDSDVDWYVKKVICEGVAQYNADWGIAMVLEVGTGRIIALDDSDSIEAGSTDAKLTTSRAISQTFEPGSIGKVFSSAGMLQLGLHAMTDQFSVPDTITVDGQTYRDAFTHSEMHWTLAGILQQSSNVGMIMAAQDYTNAQRYEYISKFGIGQLSGLGLPGESSGLLYDSNSWDLRTRNTVLFGQGYAVNILQMTNAIATIANGGVRLPMSLLESVTDADGHTTSLLNKVSDGERVIDESVADAVLNAMESVAEGYASFTGIDGYRVAAKSGTAEVADGAGGLTGIVSDWSAIIPADNPKFVVSVVLKNPSGSYGGLTAGPLFKQIGEFLMRKYDVEPSSERTDVIPVEW